MSAPGAIRPSRPAAGDTGRREPHETGPVAGTRSPAMETMMAGILSREAWVTEAQAIYDDTEKSGANYTRLSTTRRKLQRLLADAGVEEPTTTAAELVAEVQSDVGE